MFRCELCERVSQPGESQIKVIVERRPAEYPSRGKAQRSRVGRRSKFGDDPGGAGYEIVREKIACVACIDEHIEREPVETL
ncbi:MAG: hypothetical protein AAGF92_07860 [Myxococcota bacterium]